MIAVVDDDEPVRSAVVRLLQSAGHAARGFASGTEFLLAWQIDRPKCVILDLQMPSVSGTDVLRALRRAAANLPVVMITANDRPGAREECAREGAVGYLIKPLDDDVLLESLRVALGS
jgi:FixJ family two-component response regulator